jgi:RecA-family ATPase
MALDLAVAVSMGGKFLHYFDMSYPGAVLYLALEDNE